MATEDRPRSFRPNKEDRQILEWLYEHTGQDFSGVIRLALRRLYAHERRIVFAAERVAKPAKR